MTVQPAYETTLEHDGATVTLKASLRAAVTIANMPGGFAGASDGLLSQSYTACRAVLLATATDKGEARHYLARWSGRPLADFVSVSQAACLSLLAAFLQPGDDDAAQASSRGSDGERQPTERMTFDRYFQTLYGYATGWLGWTPAETWAASPQEIEAAFRAHVDRLMQTSGYASDDTDQPKPDNAYTLEHLQQIEKQGFDPAFDREALRALKAKS